MYDVRSDYQRNLQLGFFYSQPLQVINLFNPFHIEEATYFLFANHIAKLGIHHRACHQIATGRKVQLSQLLTNSHFTHQIRYKTIHFRIFSSTGRRTGKEGQLLRRHLGGKERQHAQRRGQYSGSPRYRTRIVMRSTIRSAEVSPEISGSIPPELPSGLLWPTSTASNSSLPDDRSTSAA